MTGKKKGLKSVSFRTAFILSLVGLFGLLTVLGVFASSEVTETVKAVATGVSSDVQKWGLLAAAIAFSVGAIGAAIAISNVGAAAMGAIAEKPEVAGQALIFIALGEGIVVFGFITALMIMGKV
ncbi:MAG: ATPase [Spirochaetes bacterium]|nr:MAG: ATPase [Spirochaetota bacterium]